MQGLRPAQHRREGLDRGPGDVVHRLLRRQGHAGRLRVEPEPLRGGIGGPVAIPQPARPDATGCPEFRDLLEEVDVGVEEEA